MSCIRTAKKCERRFRPRLGSAIPFVEPARSAAESIHPGPFIYTFTPPSPPASPTAALTSSPLRLLLRLRRGRRRPALTLSRSVRGARPFRGWKLRRGLARRDDGRNLVGCDAAAVHLRTFLGLEGVLVCLRVGDGGAAAAALAGGIRRLRDRGVSGGGWCRRRRRRRRTGRRGERPPRWGSRRGPRRGAGAMRAREGASAVPQ